MDAAYMTVAVLAIVAFGFSGVAAIAHLRWILPAMARVGVPESWLTMLGVLKVAGAAGVLLGLLGVPFIAEAAALGLVLFFIGAIAVHLRAHDYSAQLGFATGLLTLGIATFAVELVAG